MKEELLRLADLLERFIAMPEWPRFYMDKEQGKLCAAALRAYVEAARAALTQTEAP